VVAAHAVAEEDAALELAAERDRLAALVTSQEATIGDLRARLWNQDARLVELQDSLAAHNAASAPPPPDLEAAAAVLGEKVRHNDLTVIDGIGPKIADLLQREGGIKTWWDLHLTDVATLRALLETGGPRFQVHDPSSWPEQAGLLARGEWQQFQTLVARLQGGKLGG
jgi:predicted flap endonuclease-1-like 5' DNA nuclease